jgi:hypothetical protein
VVHSASVAANAGVANISNAAAPKIVFFMGLSFYVTFKVWSPSSGWGRVRLGGTTRLGQLRSLKTGFFKVGLKHCRKHTSRELSADFGIVTPAAVPFFSSIFKEKPNVEHI